MSIEKLSLEQLITKLHESSDRADGNIILSYKDNMFKTYVWHDGHGIMEQSENDLFLSFKKHYQKIFKKPIIEIPGDYILSSFHQIVIKACSVVEYITIVPLKGNRYEVSAKLTDKNKTVLAMGTNVNHALVFLLREFTDLGIEV